MKTTVSMLTLMVLLILSSTVDAQEGDQEQTQLDGTESTEESATASETAAEDVTADSEEAEEVETEEAVAETEEDESEATETETEAGEPPGDEIDTESKEGEQEDDHIHSQNAALFVGGMSADLDKSVSYGAFVLGLDYEFRLPFIDNLFGVGLFAELGFAEQTEFSLGIPLIVHPILGLKVLVAPGLAFIGHTDTSGGSVGASVNPQLSSETEFLLRIGVAYEFHLVSLGFGSLFAAPVFNFDMVGEHVALVYGGSIGIGFL